MKKYLISLATALLFTATGCSDSWLQQDSLTESSPATFWKTSNDATAALAACYDGLQTSFIYNGNHWALGACNFDALSDNAGFFNWSGWKPGYDLMKGTLMPTSWLLSDYYKQRYEVIKRCNSLLDNVDRVDMSDALKAQYKAEAYTLRALMYIDLTMTYQNVPYITATQSMDNASMGATKRAEIVEGEMANLKASVGNLPDQAALGRITKGACYAVLGRMALYNEKWSDAIDAYKAVLALGCYSLAPDYHKLFTLEGQTSSEIIMTVRFEGPGQNEGTSFIQHWGFPADALNPTINLADAYYTLDGKPCDTSNDADYGAWIDGKLDINNPNPAHWENRDPRLKATLFVPGMLWNGKGNAPGVWYGGAKSSKSTVYPFKYYDPSDTTWGNDTGQDFYVIRLPEVLLSLAEAYVMKGGYDESEVCSLVNQVRQRVGMPAVEDVEGTGLSKQALLDVVKHERRVELALEGLRTFDLYRWHEWEQSIKAIEAERTRFGLSYEPRMSMGERDYVWPIPTAEIDANKELEQHELWK